MKDLENRNCLVCDRIGLIIKGKNKYFVKELVSGYVVLCDFQFYFGYTLFLSKTHVNELHKLSKRERYIFLKEMAKVAEAVYKTFKPKKLNYGLIIKPLIASLVMAVALIYYINSVSDMDAITGVIAIVIVTTAALFFYERAHQE